VEEETGREKREQKAEGMGMICDCWLGNKTRGTGGLFIQEPERVGTGTGDWRQTGKRHNRGQILDSDI